MKNYISAEEFLSLDKEVQKVFIDWWNPSLTDCYISGFGNLCSIKDERQSFMSKNYKNECIPLLQMHQLIAFIEEKTKLKINFKYTSTRNGELMHYIDLDKWECIESECTDSHDINVGKHKTWYKTKTSVMQFYQSKYSDTDILKCLFKVSCEIAKQITQE